VVVGLGLGPLTEPAPPAVAGARPRERRFRIYNVGIAKTGTQSVAGIFANYRSLHEYLFADTVEAIAQHASGALSHAAFREFIRWRDGVARLDVDSSSYNAFYADILAQEFADAQFIFVIRDCWSWLDSMLNMVLRIGPGMPTWMVEHCRVILGPHLLPDLAAHASELARRLPALVDDGLRYWASANRFVLEALPPERSLVVRTAELSTSLPRLADFVGVPVETLRTDLRHVHRGPQRFHTLQQVDRGLLLARYMSDCADLMDTFFPTSTLERFLLRDAARD
jgi:hypothetical protein